MCVLITDRLLVAQFIVYDALDYVLNAYIHVYTVCVQCMVFLTAHVQCAM